ncbi:tetratricopeptide repeat protein [Aquibacillus halophilus]|uniref:Tetratricopeptide repeat protein n=1 Tax=Aquibacillus halophilus TaxID=930132 RepID=A0A6A8DGV0_9BACI|nr:tetratricopeptide repeat protein [Aquibacillus halophilus]MRH42941.1 tetratricopeptide repeat protein [Aquibacillus halophilus]
MFPKWKSTLEQESMNALKEKRYDDALTKLNQLIAHDVVTHEIVMGKLICLMEIGNYDEAEDLCHQLISNNDSHLFDYIHIYSTLLFQQSKYEMLIEELEEVFQRTDIPNSLKPQLNQLYEISKKLNIDKKEEEATRNIKKLKTAIRKQDYPQQWRILKDSREVSVDSHIEYLKELLVDFSINPIIKTAVIQWLQEQKINDPIEVTKFETAETVIPSQLNTLTSHPITIQIEGYLHEIEQNNPSLFELIKKLLYRYLYVRFPIMPADEELVHISEALKLLGYQYLQMETNMDIEDEEKLNSYLIDIITSEKEYFEIVGE